MNNNITSYPLYWPEGWKRTKTQTQSRFGTYKNKVTISKATWFVLDELRKKGIPDWNVIISSNLKLRLDGLPYSGQKQPDDSGVSVWWSEGDSTKVIAVDIYKKVEDNLYAIGKTIEALRGIDRWGGGEILERTFKGFEALPHNPTTPSWREVLGTDSNNPEEIKQAFRKARFKAHPDIGNGSEEAFNRVMEAWKEAEKFINQNT